MSNFSVMQRLGLKAEWGQKYFTETYNSKRSRIWLTEAELLDLLKYLESQLDQVAGL
jgi:hypothetical protein